MRMVIHKLVFSLLALLSLGLADDADIIKKKGGA